MVRKSGLKKLAGINLALLGILLDLDLNRQHAPIIAKQESPVTVRVLKTKDGLMIARQTRDRLTG